jgi:hypothetical protein
MSWLEWACGRTGTNDRWSRRGLKIDGFFATTGIHASFTTYTSFEQYPVTIDGWLLIYLKNSS